MNRRRRVFPGHPNSTPPIGEMRCSSGGKRLAHPKVPGLYGGYLCLRRRNDSFRLTDVMERSLRVLAGRLSTDARVWTGVQGRFGRRLATEPVVRTETSSIREEGGIPGESVPQARQRRGVARVAPAATRGSNLDEFGQVQGANPSLRANSGEENTRATQDVYLRNA